MGAKITPKQPLSCARSRTFRFRMPPSGLEITDGYWQSMMASHLQSWKAACSALKTREDLHSDRQVEIEFDWQPILKSCQHFSDTMQRVEHGNPGQRAEALANFQRENSEVPVKVRLRPAPSSKTPGGRYQFSAYANSKLADVFLILNIANPGCCNFYRSELVAADPDYVHRDCSYSALQFEFSSLRTYEAEWPHVEVLDVDAVLNWFDRVRTGFGLLPRSSVERALFAMLNIAAGELSPTTVVWIFYALESLLDTRPGENCSAIERRVSMLLNINEKQRAILRKGLRALYDYRSSVVHGGLKMIHPLHNEQLDPSIDDEYGRMMDVADFGFTILLACIQELVRKKCVSLSFVERMKVDG